MARTLPGSKWRKQRGNSDTSTTRRHGNLPSCTVADERSGFKSHAPVSRRARGPLMVQVSENSARVEFMRHPNTQHQAVPGYRRCFASGLYALSPTDEG